MSLCGPSACGTCPLRGYCGDPSDLPSAPGRPRGVLAAVGPSPADRPEWRACRTRAEDEVPCAVDLDGPDVDPHEPRPEDAPSCCGGACSA